MVLPVMTPLPTMHYHIYSDAQSSFRPSDFGTDVSLLLLPSMRLCLYSASTGFQTNKELMIVNRLDAPWNSKSCSGYSICRGLHSCHSDVSIPAKVFKGEQSMRVIVDIDFMLIHYRRVLCDLFSSRTWISSFPFPQIINFLVTSVPGNVCQYIVPCALESAD